VLLYRLSLVRNYLPSHEWVLKGGWNIADCVQRSYDLEAMEVGTVAAGRIGLAVLRRLKAFDVKLHPDYALPSVTKHLVARHEFRVVS
jgi:formate dehydrogenase